VPPVRLVVIFLGDHRLAPFEDLTVVDKMQFRRSSLHELRGVMPEDLSTRPPQRTLDAAVDEQETSVAAAQRHQRHRLVHNRLQPGLALSERRLGTDAFLHIFQTIEREGEVARGTLQQHDLLLCEKIGLQ